MSEEPEKESKEKVWSTYTAAEYKKAIDEMVHHSFKIVHSAITGGGVRVAKEAGIKLPYVSVRTLVGHGHDVLTDHYGKGPMAINIHQQITAVAEGLAQKAPAGEVAIIQDFLDSASHKGYVKCSSISPRLRQILLPTEAGYLCVSPIASAGVSVMIGAALKGLNDRIDTQNKDKQNEVRPLRKVKRATLPLGGSKPFNVGNLVYKITSPILGSFPVADNTLRHAIALFHSGQVSLSFPKALVADYLRWRNSLSGAVSANAAVRDEHKSVVLRFARHWLAMGADAYEILIENRESLPSKEDLLNPSLPAFDRGLVDPDQRDSAWGYLFSSKLAQRISKLEKDEARQFEYSQTEINTISKIVREMLV